MSPKVLIVHKNPKVHNPNACHAGLGVTANNETRVLNSAGITAITAKVIDGYDLRNGLSEKRWGNITHVVLCAPFFDTAFLRQLCNKFPTVMFTVVFHSNAGFLGLDKWAMGILGEQIQVQTSTSNFKVATNSKKFSRVVKSIFKTEVLTLQNLYWLRSFKQYIHTTHPPYKKNSPLKIGDFCAIRSLKNIPTAAFAAAVIATELKVPVEFHIMKGREEDAAAEKIVTGIKRLFANIPNIVLVEDEWREWNEFKEQVVRKMDILLQPSFTESFNNVTADGIDEGIASVVGEAIDWVPENWQANADDAYEIAEVAIDLLFDKHAPLNGFHALVKHNKEALENWEEWILELGFWGKLGKKVKKWWN